MNRFVVRLAAALALAAWAHVVPAGAAGPTVTYVSSTGTDSGSCTAALPCATLLFAGQALGTFAAGQISCLDSPGGAGGAALAFTGSATFPGFTVDCFGVFAPTAVAGVAVQLNGVFTVKIRHLTFSGAAGSAGAIQVSGSGSLIIEDCVMENFSSNPPVVIQPNGPLTLVIKNTRISNSGAGIVINPSAAGSVNASLDRVTIAQNSGGGIKIQTGNGPVTVDITNSEVSYNSGNGINAVAGANQAIVSIKNSVIARNGAAGVQANGANAGVLVATTLFDQNAAGATTIVSGGNMFTYGNNDVVGALGAGFPTTAPLH